MAEIVKIKKDGVIQYPITKPECVIDENGKNVLQLIKENGGSTPDLSEYLTKEEFNKASEDFATTDALEGYATTQQLTELSAEVSGLSEKVDALGEGGSDIFKAIYRETTIEEVTEAYNAGKVIHCDYNGYCYTLAKFNNGTAFFAATAANYNFRIVLSPDSSWGAPEVFTLEQTSNKTKTINSASTDTQYPSAKAVYDAIQQSGGGGTSTKRFALLYETTIEAETDRLDLITLVPNILDNKDFVIGMELVAGDGTTARNMSVNFSAKNAGFNCCRINGLNKQSYQIFYLVKIHIGNDWMFDSSCYVECHNNSWNNEQKADGLQGLNLFIYQQNAYPIDTMYITFPFKVGDKIRIYGK